MFEGEHETANRVEKVWLEDNMSSEERSDDDIDSNISSSSDSCDDEAPGVPKLYIAKAMEMQMGDQFKNMKISDIELSKNKYMKNLPKKEREEIAKLMNQNRARRINGNNLDLFIEN
jgi:hypothetical protein